MNARKPGDRRLLEQALRERDEARRIAEEWRRCGRGVPDDAVERGYAFPWELDAKAPTCESQRLPELPPGYDVVRMDDFDDPQFNGWHIVIDGDYYERLGCESPPQERDEAVEECWDMWLSTVSEEWQVFISAHREVQP